MVKTRNGYHKEPTFDAASQYDKYYAPVNGEDSIYSKQYQGKVLPRDEYMLIDSAKKCINSIEADTLKILDHGFGDGRYFSVIEKIAQEAEKKNKKVKLIAYEPSLVGLKNFANEQKQRGYEGVDDLKFKDTSKINASGHELKVDGYSAGTISKGNLEVEFIHSNIQDSIPHSKKLIGGDVGMTMSMFGVLSHIPGRAKRQDVFKMFHDITNKDGEVIVTVPSYARFKREHEAYKVWREHNPDSPTSSLVTEEGDLFYCRFSDSKQYYVKNFYHLYDEKELKEDLKEADLVPHGGVQSNHILDIKLLIRNPVLAQIDAFFSQYIPPSMSSYMSAVSTPRVSTPRKKKEHFPNPSTSSNSPKSPKGFQKSASWAGVVTDAREDDLKSVRVKS